MLGGTDGGVADAAADQVAKLEAATADIMVIVNGVALLMVVAGIDRSAAAWGPVRGDGGDACRDETPSAHSLRRRRRNCRKESAR